MTLAGCLTPYCRLVHRRTWDDGYCPSCRVRREPAKDAYREVLVAWLARLDQLTDPAERCHAQDYVARIQATHPELAGITVDDPDVQRQIAWWKRDSPGVPARGRER